MWTFVYIQSTYALLFLFFFLKVHPHAIYQLKQGRAESIKKVYNPFITQATANDIYRRIIKRSLASLPCSLKWHLVVGHTYSSEEQRCDWLQDSPPCWSRAAGWWLYTTVSCYGMWFDVNWCDVWGSGLLWGLCHVYVFVSVYVHLDISESVA